MRRFSLAVAQALLFLAVLGFEVASASAFCRLTTVKKAVPDETGCIREGIPLAWDRRCFSYTLHQDGSRDVPFEAVQALVTAGFAPWSVVSCGARDLGFEFAQTPQNTTYRFPYFNTDRGNHNAIIFVNDWDARDHDLRAFALTTVWHDKCNGRIVDGDMEINESAREWGQCAVNNFCGEELEKAVMDGQVEACPVTDLSNVIAHEAGHFLGLAHSNVENSTMFSSAPDGETCKRSLEEDDLQGICATYPEGSLPMQCDPTPNGGYYFGAPMPSDGCWCGVRSENQTGVGQLLVAALMFLRRRRR